MKCFNQIPTESGLKSSVNNVVKFKVDETVHIVKYVGNDSHPFELYKGEDEFVHDAKPHGAFRSYNDLVEFIK